MHVSSMRLVTVVFVCTSIFNLHSNVVGSLFDSSGHPVGASGYFLRNAVRLHHGKAANVGSSYGSALI